MIYRLFILLVLFIGCNSSSKIEEKSNFFSDLDIYSLSGINKVNSEAYPNIEIMDRENYRMLKYHIDSGNFFQRKYVKDGDKWVLSFFEKDDTTNIYTTRIISYNQLVEFSYSDTNNYRIYDVGILRNDTMTYYRPDYLYSRKLNLNDLPSIIESEAYKVKFWFDTSGKKIQVYKLFNEEKDRVNIPIKNCYLKNNRSFFWWYETQDYQNPIPCE